MDTVTKDAPKAPPSKKDEEPQVSYGPVPIQTAQDAAAAYLAGKIDEDKLREICSNFGILPGQLFPNSGQGERVDSAFENKLPNDLYLDPPPPEDSLEIRQKALKEKEDQRKAATEEAAKPSKETEKK